MIFCAFLGREKCTAHTEKVSQVSDVSKENAAERKTFSSFGVAKSDWIKPVLKEENYISIKYQLRIIAGSSRKRKIEKKLKRFRVVNF